MKYIIILLLLITQCLHAQLAEGMSSVRLKIYNPTGQTLTAIIKRYNRTPEEPSSRFVALAPDDTTVFDFEMIMPERNVATDLYELKIYEAPNYYFIQYHSNWNCERIEGEYYSCLHSILPEIQIADSLRFSKTEYEFIERNNMPIYDFVEVQPKYIDGIESFMEGSRAVIQKKKFTTDVKIYVSFVAELDSTVSDIKVLKSSHPDFDADVIKYFEGLQFIPGLRAGVAVRSRMTLPVRVNVK
jgi:hypothetical protein